MFYILVKLNNTTVAIGPFQTEHAAQDYGNRNVVRPWHIYVFDTKITDIFVVEPYAS